MDSSVSSIDGHDYRNYHYCHHQRTNHHPLRSIQWMCHVDGSFGSWTLVVNHPTFWWWWWWLRGQWVIGMREIYQYCHAALNDHHSCDRRSYSIDQWHGLRIYWEMVHEGHPCRHRHYHRYHDGSVPNQHHVFH